MAAKLMSCGLAYSLTIGDKEPRLSHLTNRPVFYLPFLGTDNICYLLILMYSLM